MPVDTAMLTAAPRAPDCTMPPVNGITLPDNDARKFPGDPPFWIFILGDLLIFAVIFIAFVHAGAVNPDEFNAGRDQLNQTFGLINTLVLLGGSWFVALGIKAHRTGKSATATALLLTGVMTGVIFCTVKFFEYSDKIAAGFYPDSSAFFMFYYVVTGIHLFHVVVAVVVMAVTLLVYRGRPSGPDVSYAGLESAGLLWHLVDLLWIFLFAIIYLLAFPA